VLPRAHQNRACTCGGAGGHRRHCGVRGEEVEEAAPWEQRSGAKVSGEEEGSRGLAGGRGCEIEGSEPAFDEEVAEPGCFGS